MVQTHVAYDERDAQTLNVIATQVVDIVNNHVKQYSFLRKQTKSMITETGCMPVACMKNEQDQVYVCLSSPKQTFIKTFKKESTRCPLEEFYIKEIVGEKHFLFKEDGVPRESVESEFLVPSIFTDRENELWETACERVVAYTGNKVPVKNAETSIDTGFDQTIAASLKLLQSPMVICYLNKQILERLSDISLSKTYVVDHKLVQVEFVETNLQNSWVIGQDHGFFGTRGSIQGTVVTNKFSNHIVLFEIVCCAINVSSVVKIEI